MAGNSFTVIKRYADNYFTVTQLKHKKPVGRIAPFPSGYIYPQKNLFGLAGLPDLNKIKEDRDTKHIGKLQEHLVRARTKIFEIAMCNNWEYFCTFTISPEKYDRYNLSGFYKDFAQYIRNQNRCHNADIKYLLIPEMHKDGAWHLHGLMSGLPEIVLRKFTLGEKLPRYIRDQLLLGRSIYEWCGYSHRFGFCDIEKIRNLEACCKYVVKYITKDIGRSVREFHAKLYYCSKGLNRPTVVYEGEDNETIAFPDFANVWMDRKDFFSFGDALEYSTVKFVNSFINSGLDDDTIQRILAG